MVMCDVLEATAGKDYALVKEGKVIPLQGQCGPEGGQRYSCTLP